MDYKNEELEKYVVGCMIQDENCAIRCLEINEKHFTNNEVRNIYNQVVNILEQNKTVELFELAIRKVDSNTLNECYNSATTTVEFESKLEQFKALYNKNNTIIQLMKLTERLKETEFESTSEITETIIGSIKIQDSDKSKAKTMKDIYNDLKKEYEFFKNQKPMKYGIAKLDKYTQGIFSHELTVIAARPGMGKTALAVQASINLAKQGFKGLIFSREMGGTQIIRRIIANTFKINSYKLKREEGMTEEERKMIENKQDQFTNLNLRIDTFSETIEKIKVSCKYFKQMNQLDFVVIDYLQLLETSRKCQNREQEVAHISRQLKLLTLELEIPILLLSQLNRGSEQRQDKRPVLSDLRESGAIEQDANNVLMLYQTKSMEEDNRLDILIEKQREGAKKDVPVKYYKRTNLICDVKEGECPF